MMRRDGAQQAALRRELRELGRVGGRHGHPPPSLSGALLRAPSGLGSPPSKQKPRRRQARRRRLGQPPPGPLSAGSGPAAPRPSRCDQQRWSQQQAHPLRRAARFSAA